MKGFDNNEMSVRTLQNLKNSLDNRIHEIYNQGYREGYKDGQAEGESQTKNPCDGCVCDDGKHLMYCINCKGIAWQTESPKVVDTPSVVPSRAEGEWKVKFPYKDTGKTRTCTNCHITQTVNVYDEKVMFRFCPYCGAKMKG